MVELMEHASLELAKALAIAALLRPDGLTDQIEHIEAAMSALEDAIRNGKNSLDQATSQAMADQSDVRALTSIRQTLEQQNGK